MTLAAFVAGALYAFASNRAVYAALGHYDMVTTQWIPFYALMLLRALDGTLSPRLRRRAAVLGGVFFALTGLAEMISALFLGIFTLIVVIVAVIHGRKQPDRWARLTSGLAALAIIGAVAFVLWAPALIPILIAFARADYDLKGWGDALILSTDLLGWFTPTVFHPLFGGDIVRELHLVQQRALNPDLPGFRDLNTVFLGWASLGLAVLGAVAYRRKLAAWIWTTVLFGLFTLGPLLQVNGRTQFDMDGIATTVPLPFALLHYLPIIKANRAPNRNSVVLMLGLAVLAGYGVLWLLAWLERRQAKRAPRTEFRPETEFFKETRFLSFRRFPPCRRRRCLPGSHPLRAPGAAVPAFRCAHPRRLRPACRRSRLRQRASAAPRLAQQLWRLWPGADAAPVLPERTWAADAGRQHLAGA